MNRTKLTNQLLELEIELSKAEYDKSKLYEENRKFMLKKHELANMVRLEYDVGGNATAIATWDGQERELVMPLVKEEPAKFIACFGSKLEAEGICLDGTEEWFLQKGIVYCCPRHAVMPIPAGFIWEVGSFSGRLFLVGNSIFHRISLCYAALPYLLPELQLTEIDNDLSLRSNALFKRRRELENEIKRIKADLKNTASRS